MSEIKPIRTHTTEIDLSLQILDLLTERQVPISAYELAKEARGCRVASRGNGPRRRGRPPSAG